MKDSIFCMKTIYFAHIQSISGRRPLEIREINISVQSKRNRCSVAPDIFYKIGVIDKRITVMLNGIDYIVAGGFFVTDRILAVPLQQQSNGPRLQHRISVLLHHVLRLICIPFMLIMLVHGSHVEISSGKVTFVLIGRFKNRAYITVISTRTNFTHSIIESGCT